MPAPLPWRLQRPCACALIAPAQSSTCAEGLIFLAANASTPSPQACAASIPAALRQLGRDARWGWLRRAGARSRASRLAPKLAADWPGRKPCTTIDCRTHPLLPHWQGTRLARFSSTRASLVKGGSIKQTSVTVSTRPSFLFGFEVRAGARS